MITSAREPSSLTSQRLPPQTPLAMTGLDPGPTAGRHERVGFRFGCR
jgi:hypothetical protein